MLENFNEDKRKNSMTQFSDFHTGWSMFKRRGDEPLVSLFIYTFTLKAFSLGK